MSSTASLTRPSQASTRHTTSSHLSRSERAATRLQAVSNRRSPQDRSGHSSFREERVAARLRPNDSFRQGPSGMPPSTLMPSTRARARLERAAAPSVHSRSTSSNSRSQAELSTAPASVASRTERATTRLSGTNTTSTTESSTRDPTRTTFSTSTAASRAEREAARLARSTASSSSEASRDQTRSTRKTIAEYAAARVEYEKRSIEREKRFAERLARRKPTDTTLTVSDATASSTRSISTASSGSSRALSSSTIDSLAEIRARRALRAAERQARLDNPSSSGKASLVSASNPSSGRASWLARKDEGSVAAPTGRPVPRSTVQPKTNLAGSFAIRSAQEKERDRRFEERRLLHEARMAAKAQEEKDRVYEERRLLHEARMAEKARVKEEERRRKAEEEERELEEERRRLIEDIIRYREEKRKEAEEEARRVEEERRMKEEEVRRAAEEARRAEQERRRVDRFAEERRYQERRAARAAEAEGIRREEEDSLIRFTERCRIHRENMAERAAELEEIRQEDEQSRIRFTEQKRKAVVDEVCPPVQPKAKRLIITRNKGKPDEVVSIVHLGRRKPAPAPEPSRLPAPEAITHSAPEAPTRSAGGIVTRSAVPTKPKLFIRRGPEPTVLEPDMTAVLVAALNPPPITYNPPIRYGRFAQEASTHSAPAASTRSKSKADTHCASDNTTRSVSCLKKTGSAKHKSVQFSQELETVHRFEDNGFNYHLLYTPHEDRAAKRPVQWKTGTDESPVLDRPYETMWVQRMKEAEEEELRIPSRKPILKPVTEFRHSSQRHRVEQVRDFYGVQALEQAIDGGRWTEVRQKFPFFYGLRNTRVGTKSKWTGVLLDDCYPFEDGFHPRSFGKLVRKGEQFAFLSEPYQVNEGNPGVYAKYQCEKGGACLRFSHGRPCGCDSAWVQWFGTPGDMKAYRIPRQKPCLAPSSPDSSN